MSKHFPISERAKILAARVDGVSDDSQAVGSRPHYWRHICFGVVGIISIVVYWEPLRALAELAAHSDYYSHTILIPVLSGYLIFRAKRKVFANMNSGLGLGFLLIFAAVLLLGLQKWAIPLRLPMSIFSIVLLWVGCFSLCYGLRAVRYSLFPLIFLLLTIPLPMGIMEEFVHLTRVGSAEVASGIFMIVGVPVFREGFYFLFPGLTIEIAKECSGIHSTIALFVVALMGGYLFLKSSWKRALLVGLIFPIVSVTNGLRIAALSLLALYVDRNILNSSLHRDGGILFFGIALMLLTAIGVWVSKAPSLKHGLKGSPRPV